MKRESLFSIIILILLIFVSSCSLTPMDEGSGVNNYIFPYVNFALSEDGTYYTATIVSGAALSEVYITSLVDDFDTAIPVKYFAGFDNSKDIVNLKNTVLESSSTIIKLKSLNQAAILDTIHYEKVERTDAVWTNLPNLPHTGEYEFIGWYTSDTDERVESGVTLIKEHQTIYAKRLKVEVVHHEKADATCTTEGNIEYWECRNCGLLFSDSECTNQITEVTIPSLGHELIYIEKKEATCEEEGILAHYMCLRCHNLFKDEGASESTTLDDLKISALDHVWERREYSETITCTWNECTRCHETKDAAGHTWNEGSVEKDATETEHGIMLFTCTVCSLTKREDIAPLDSIGHNHTWVDCSPVAPTCTTRGYTTRTCSECDTTYNYNYIDAPGHTMTEIAAKDATCTENGNSKYYKCSVCEDLYKDRNGINRTTLEEVQEGKEATGHKYSRSDYKKNRTYHWHICVVCGIEIEGSREEHSYTEKPSVEYKFSDATCTSPAVYYKSCVCREVGKETFEYGNPLGHKTKHVEAKIADCGNAGNIEYWECSVCGVKFYDKACTREIPEGGEIEKATGNHTFDFYVSFGSLGHKKHCSVCNQEYGDYLSHDINTYSWKSDSSSHWHECKDCGYKENKSGHEYVTYGTDSVCSVCGHVKGEEEKTTDGGFDINPETLEPRGKLIVEGTSVSFTATFTLDSDSKMTSIVWYLENEKLEGETGTTCSFSALERRTYHIMCLVYNGTLISSFEQTVIGGGST